MVLTKGNHTYPQETVIRVEQAANQLGYIPNRFAQALKTNKTMSIACIVPDIANPFYASLVRGVQSVTDRYHYDAIVASTDGLRERELHFCAGQRRGGSTPWWGHFLTSG